jgi:hypothetical protein
MERFSSNSEQPGDELIRMDLENNVREGEEKQPGLLIRVWKIPVPL